MAKKTAASYARQWKVLRGVHIDGLQQTLAQWTAKGWTVFSIIGPLGGIAVVLERIIEL